MSSCRLRHAAPDDAASVASVVSEHERAVTGSSTYNRSDLDDEWRTLDLTADAWVVTEPEGRVVGYGTVEDRGELWRESDTGAFRLYERMGMEPAWAAVIFEKALDA